jgi:hypothetical protein
LRGSVAAKPHSEHQLPLHAYLLHAALRHGPPKNSTKDMLDFLKGRRERIKKSYLSHVSPFNASRNFGEPEKWRFRSLASHV